MSLADTDQFIQEACNDGIITYDNQNLYYKCLLCNKHMTGEAPLIQHLKSKKHEEVAFRYAISRGRDCPESLKKLLPFEIQRAVKGGVIEASNTGIHCKACKKDLNGLSPLNQHLSGADHRKHLNGVQLRIPSFVTGSNNNSEEAPSSFKEPCNGSGIKLPSQLTQTNNYSLPSTITTPIPTLSFRNDQRQTSNGATLLEPSRSRLPEPVGLYGTQPSHRDTSPIRFPTRLSPVQPINLFTPPINSFPRRSENAEVTSPTPQPKQTLPLIGTGPHSLDHSNGMVLQAVNEGVLSFNKDTLGYECNVCQRTFIAQQTEDHLRHKSHMEAIARLVISESGQGPPSLLEMLPRNIVDAAKTAILTITETNHFRCTICNATINGVIPLKQHLEGAEHLKKNGISAGQTTFPRLHSMYRPTASTENNAFGRTTEHMHQTNEVDIDILTEAFKTGLVFSADGSTKSEMKCRVCNVSLNSLKNLEQHLTGVKHLKQLQKSGNDIQPTELKQQFVQSTGNSEGPDRGRESTLQVQPYLVNSEPRGHVYIFNYKFIGRTKDPKERRGAEKDTVNLMKTFIDMGYNVFPREDLTAKETMNALDEIRCSSELETVDALIMFFLSHGNEPYKFFAEDTEKIDLQHDIWEKFTNSSCPSMKNKPKIIFANFCRGKYSEMVETDSIKDIPRDLVTIHAATEGIKTWRNLLSGTYFVQSLCEALRRYASRHDLRTIYGEIDPIVKSLGGTQLKWEDSRFKTFYFNPMNPILS